MLKHACCVWVSKLVSSHRASPIQFKASLKSGNVFQVAVTNYMCAERFQMDSLSACGHSVRMILVRM